MSDNHEKFQDGFGSVQNTDSNGSANNGSTPYTYGNTYSTNPNPQNNANAPQTYTWSAQNGPYQSGGYSPTHMAPQPAPKKKRGTPFGVKLLAVVLCCVVVSAATLGTFVLLIQNGVINIESSGSNAAFTISRVVNDETQETGSVSTMSEQDIAEKLIPSVVCIQNYQITQQYGFMQTDSEGSEVSPAGEGSGIVFSEDGYIVTNAHVVDGATSLKVILSDGTTYEAELVGSDELTDLAVIKIDATGLQAAEFGSSEDLRVADQVMAIGNPGGYQLNSSVTIGYVSALNRAITNSSTGYTMEYIQTDAAINPGNSGGALVNQYGQVVGINSAKISATGYEGLGFALPAETAQPVISDLIEYGYVKDRAMLGISGQFIDSLTGRFYGLPQGEYVGALNSDEAQASGLQVGDVITSIDGTALESEAVLRSMINEKKPGDTVELEVYRPSTNNTLTITLELSESTGS
ncbi:S1C family serine protease [Hominenteromicrobium sp.]